MITFPNAKINLGLYVERKREDGYHDLSTVFYPIPLTDAVEVVEGNRVVHLWQSGGLPSGKKSCDEGLPLDGGRV